MQSQDVRKILIEASTYCNARCPHCARFTADGYVHPDLPLQHLDLVTLQNSLNSKQLTNLSRVAFGGGKGDPAMNPQLIDLVKFFDFVPVVAVNSNGGVQSELWWKQLAQVPNLTVTFSIDGLEDTNELYRVGVNWDRVIRNVRAFISAGGDAIWKTVIFKHNEHQIDDIINFSRELGCRRTEFDFSWKFAFAQQNPWPVKIEGRLSHYISDSELSTPKIQKRSVDHGPNPRHDYQAQTINENHCPWISKGEIFIDALGYVLPCCHTHYEHLNSWDNGKYFRTLTGPLDNISLKQHNLNAVLNSDFFAYRLNESLKQKETQHQICQGCLGS
jgi:MoaA/NifB/PqqE/SkfB family radical SAM enzyme